MIADWMRRELVITHGGRRFVCRPPSLRTVSLALGAFLPVFQATSRAWAESGAEWDTGASERLLGVVCDGPAVIPVLSSCATLVGGEPGQLDELLADDQVLRLLLARVALAMLDIGLVLANAQDLLAAGDDGPAGDDETALLSVAMLLRLPPLEVMELPYGLFCSLAAAAAAYQAPGRAAPGDAARTQPMSVDEFMGGA